MPGGFQILKYVKGSWVKMKGGAKRLIISNSGRPYILTRNNRIYWPDESKGETCTNSTDFSSHDLKVEYFAIKEKKNWRDA